MRLAKLLVLALALAASLHAVSGLYLMIDATCVCQNKPVCFTEEIPRGERVAVRYKVDSKFANSGTGGANLDAEPEAGGPAGRGLVGKGRNPGGDAGVRPRVTLVVRDPNRVFVQKQVQSIDVDHSYSFVTEEEGDYEFCLTLQEKKAGFGLQFLTRRFFQRRLHIHIMYGEQATTDEELALELGSVSALENKIYRLNMAVDDVWKEQQYQRHREATFRDTSESTNRRVWMFTMFQLTVVLAVGAWQMKYLEKFFLAKKML